MPQFQGSDITHPLPRETAAAAAAAAAGEGAGSAGGYSSDRARHSSSDRPTEAAGGGGYSSDRARFAEREALRFEAQRHRRAADAVRASLSPLYPHLVSLAWPSLAWPGLT
jgi:hypothetical protein